MARDVLSECAWAAARTRDTHLSAQFWRLARKTGKKKGRDRRRPLDLVIVWHLLANDYADLGGDYIIRRNNPDRHRDRRI